MKVSQLTAYSSFNTQQSLEGEKTRQKRLICSSSSHRADCHVCYLHVLPTGTQTDNTLIHVELDVLNGAILTVELDELCKTQTCAELDVLNGATLRRV